MVSLSKRCFPGGFFCSVRDVDGGGGGVSIPPNIQRSASTLSVMACMFSDIIFSLTIEYGNEMN